MAMFREHIAIGAIISMVVVVGVYFYALLTDPLLLLFLFGVTIIGSFLPDVDSDSGMPFYLVFGTMTLAATGVVLLYVLASPYAEDWRFLTGIPLGALAFFWLVVGGILKKCTNHRGIFHSLPAMVIAGVATYLIARQFGLEEFTAFVFGAAMAVGFASHLVLDEIHSFVDLEGIPFIPKKSLGTALKLFSDSSRVNLATYVLLAALVFTAVKAPAAEAYFYNDSVIIEIGTGTPTILEPGSGGSGSEPGSGSGGGDSGSGGSGETGAGSGTGVGGGSGSSGSGAGAGSGSDASGGVSGGGSGGTGDRAGGETLDEEDEDSVLDILIEEDAIAGVSSGSGSTGASGSAGAGISGGISVNAGKVRSALRNSYNLREILFNWTSSKSTGNKARDYGLMAASTALRDSNVDAVTLSASAFSIKYRSRGYIFALFPMSFPVSVEVVPAASNLEERVKVKLPWYQFFVREFFTKKTLSEDIDVVIQAELAVESDTEVQSRLLEVVSQLLLKKIGTVGGSVQTN